MKTNVLEGVKFDNFADREETTNESLADMSLVSDVKVELEVKLGHLTMTMGELFDLKAGEVLKMNQSVNEPVEVYLGEKRVALGNLVAVDEHLGVEITDVVKR